LIPYHISFSKRYYYTQTFPSFQIDDVLNSVDSLLDVESEAAKEGLAQSRSGNM
jgi:hypothetical protein